MSVLNLLKRYRGSLLFALAFVAFVALMAYLLWADRQPNPRDATRLSVVVYGESEDRWRSLDQGIRQACLELGIEKPVLTLVPADDAARQTELLQREVAAGTNGLLVAMAGSDPGVTGYLEEQNGLNIPVVLMESESSDMLPCVAADNAAIGRTLAEEVCAEGVSVALLAGGLERTAVRQRYDAFLQRAAELGQFPTLLQNNDPRMTTLQFISSALAQRQPDVLVALDNDQLEIAAQAVTAAMTEVRLCGVGSSETVVHALDTGQISKLCYTNEYAIGYQATMLLVEKITGRALYPAGPIQYGVVDRERLYEPDIERLLFPLNQ